ncbi:polyribonucleotide nucleotidyltransferase [Candidatus Parcubacteria bacterium A4]|nr:MAG: polyribonucleotide nucleotidyltransferase [Candidatus Parcubacteria bacterium A4]
MKKEIFTTQIGGKELKVEINDFAGQASGSGFIQYGDTVVLGAATMAKNEKEGMDFFPLSVEYEERFYAAGKIFGSRYMRREGRPSDEAVLTARLIDRTIRPLFPDYLKREIQVVSTCLSWDTENDPDIVAIMSASIALSLSDIPWMGPIAAVRIGKIDENFIINPSYKEREASEIDMVLVGLEENDEIIINMIEADAKEADEKSFIEAVRFAKPLIKNLIDFQKDIRLKLGKEKIKIAEPISNVELEKEIKQFLGKRLEETINNKDKTKRNELTETLKKELADFIMKSKQDEKKAVYAKNFFEKEKGRITCENILQLEKRPDGRGIDEIREINCYAGILPRTHGSALFSRGQTKVLSIVTLGAPGDAKLIEGVEFIGKKRFLHHYNFPPYSVGETKPMRGPGRREIGHGMLAERALMSVIPNVDDFPYTVRIVSEVLSSNGSSSMASVCGSCLALMDAGVPIKEPVAGISIGLFEDKKGNYKILTDIQGAEDHDGLMDFKVAGTKKGITAIQVDVKNRGLSEKIIGEALERARTARIIILEKIQQVLEKPREKLSQFAPKILTTQINPEKIREVIGPGGKIIHSIMEECDVEIDIEESGKIFVTAEKEESAQKAIEWINNITREVKTGEIFKGKVVRILDFGAFVEILPNQQGMVHISQLADKRVNKVEDVVKIGDLISVKVISIDEQGRINLSLKDAKGIN